VEVSGERRSDIARSYDPDFHVYSCVALTMGRMSRADATTYVFLDAETVVVDSAIVVYP
jgi:hypothetical protein